MKQIRVFFLPFLLVVYLPHIVIYIFSNNKRVINLDITNKNKSLKLNLPSIVILLYLLGYDKYFFTIFNNRIKKNKFRHFLYRSSSTNFIIPDDVIVGKEINYNHPYSTILNAKSIGDNFSCKHLTTVGNKNDDENLRPVILSNVILGASVTIIGNITIGNNVIVGAGSVVVKSVPDNSIVVGNPAQLIRKNEV
jgi:serine acetyltransferase